jgi:hypothetical protein
LWRISASSHVDLIISFSGILSPSEAVIRRRKRGFVGFTSDHSLRNSGLIILYSKTKENE